MYVCMYVCMLVIFFFYRNNLWSQVDPTEIFGYGYVLISVLDGSIPGPVDIAFTYVILILTEGQRSGVRPAHHWRKMNLFQSDAI